MKLLQVYDHLKSAIKTNTPVMLWGPPGIGKSSVVHQIAKELNRKVVDLRLSQLDPTDLRGVPMPNRDTMRAEWYLPAFWPEPAVEDGEREEVRVDAKGNKKVEKVQYKAGECPIGPGVVFLDEIEKAPVSVKNASLQLVLDRCIGAYKLPDDWAIVCAGNREEDGCFSQPLGTALANRMLHFEVEHDVESWAAWARPNEVSEDIIGFLYFRSDLLYKQTNDHAFPSPRSWDMGSKMFKTTNNDKARRELLSSAVGPGAAQEFMVWQKVYKNVDPEEVIKSGTIPKELGGDDQSFKYAIALAVAFHLRKRKGGIKGVEDNVAKFLDNLGAELKVIFFKQQTLQCLEAMMKSEAFQAMRKEMMKIIV